jgi:para-nitrobenzyl esterase
MEVTSMRTLVALLTACVVLLQAGIASAEVEQFPFVLTRQEQVLGVVQAGVAAFKGIPYAAAPVGPLRWRPPQPPPESSTIRMAYDYGPACLQPSMREPRASEDCLTLNVFKPYESEDGLPVMVWIHGGSFVSGTAGDPLFDGTKLAQAGVIVVTLNYRLGAFGWLAHPALADGASNDEIANYGMMDQIAALRWIRDNITVFGGDPNNVTLFGTSSGAASVAQLMLCERSRDLFQKAILESLPGRDHVQAMDMAESIDRDFFRSIEHDGNGADPGAIESDVVLAAEKALLAKSAGSIKSARSFGPIRDGTLVTDDIASGFKAGRQSRIPLIIGSNDDETTPGADPDFNEELSLAGDAVDALRRFYLKPSSSPAELAARLYTDRVFSEPARYVARSHAATGAPTFRYRFSYGPELQSPDGDGGHGRELQFVFGAEGVPGAGVFTHQDREISNRLRAYWTNFAKTGDPNGPGLPLWDAGSKADRLLLISNAGISSSDDPWSERLDWIERRSPKG